MATVTIDWIKYNRWQRKVEYAIRENGCHEVVSHAKDAFGYCRIYFNKKANKLHRLSYEHHKGAIPEGLVVRHKCDNPCCINPEHLELGTPYENSMDAVERNRFPDRSGIKNQNCKLTEQQIIDIKTHLHAREITQRKIAKMFGVSPQLISAINTGVAWK